MSLTVTLRNAQANLENYMDDLVALTLDKLIITDDDETTELAQMVTNTVYEAADPGLSAPIINEPQIAYTVSRDKGLYRLAKLLRDHAASLVAEAVKATATIQCVAKSNLVDEEQFTLNDFGTVITFEFDVTGNGGSGGEDELIDMSGDTSAADVAATTAQIINAETTGTGDMVAEANGSVVTVTASDPGTGGNQTNTESISNTGFTVSDFILGADAPEDTATVEAMNVFGLKRTINDATPRVVIVPTKHAVAIGL